MKVKYHIQINVNGQIYHFYKWAKNSFQALRLAVRTLEIETKKVRGSLVGVYYKDCWKVERIGGKDENLIMVKEERCLK